MSKKDEWMGPSAYARHRGVNLSTVKDWIKEGKLDGCFKVSSNNRKKINSTLADQAMDHASSDLTQSGSDQENQPPSANLSLTKARTAKTALEAKTAQLKYEKILGSLVEKSEVVRVAKEMARTTRDALMTIPDRLAPILASEKEIDEINHLLAESIDDALRNLSLNNHSFFEGESNV